MLISENIPAQCLMPDAGFCEGPEIVTIDQHIKLFMLLHRNASEG